MSDKDKFIGIFHFFPAFSKETKILFGLMLRTLKSSITRTLNSLKMYGGSGSRIKEELIDVSYFPRPVWKNDILSYPSFPRQIITTPDLLEKHWQLNVWLWTYWKSTSIDIKLSLSKSLNFSFFQIFLK